MLREKWVSGKGRGRGSRCNRIVAGLGDEAGLSGVRGVRVAVNWVRREGGGTPAPADPMDYAIALWRFLHRKEGDHMAARVSRSLERRCLHLRNGDPVECGARERDKRIINHDALTGRQVACVMVAATQARVTVMDR